MAGRACAGGRVLAPAPRHLAGAAAAGAGAGLLQFALWGRLLGLASLVLGVLVLAWALYAHLATVLPRRRVGLAWTVAAVVMLGVPAWLGAQWLNRMRLTNEMYMSSLFPPSLRVAPAAPVDQLLQDAEALRAKLDRRLKDDGLADEDE